MTANRDAGRVCARFPQTLLLTWTPPGDRNVGEIILRDLSSFLPAGSLSVCEISNFTPSQLDVPYLHLDAPNDSRTVSGIVGGLSHYVSVRLSFAASCRALMRKVATFAAQNGAERLWITLSSPALIAVAALLAEELPLPTFCVVWDPPDWIVRRKGWNRWSRRWLGTRFHEVMTRSQRVMVVSGEMVNEYQALYQAPCVVVRHGMPAFTGSPRNQPATEAVVRLGFSGTVYDEGQIAALIEALNSLGWTLGGKPVVLRMIGNFFRFKNLTSPANLELLGWRSTDETLRLLAECYATYLPVPFTDLFSDFARLAFPTKLSAYLAAGRPVLVHAPSDSSAAAFCQESGVGVTCTSMDPSELREAITALVLEPMKYRRMREQVVLYYDAHFSRSAMRSAFAEFFQVPVEVLTP